MKDKLKFLAVGLLVLNLLGCASGSQPSGTQEAGKSSTTADPKAETPAQKVESVTVPAGTALSIRLTTAIDTGNTAAGSSFEGTLASALVVNGEQVAPLSSVVTGKVTNVISAGRLSRPAALSLVLTSLKPKGGERIEIATQTWSMKGQSHKKRDIEMIGGGGGAGALIGALTGGKKGAAIGGAIGAGAGTGVAATTGKKEIHLAPETKLTFRLREPVTFLVKK
jgi:hypothetical protein